MKIKNFILVYSILFTCLFLLFNLKSYAQKGYRYNGEIMG